MYKQPNDFQPVGGYNIHLTNPNAPIGVFDSGVGGLTVLRQIQRELPHESILYFGDTANLPYGTKTADEILHLVRAILRWMVAHPVKMVVMACNTSSALALETVQSEFDIPILGVILPAARSAVQNGKRIGVLATPATANSHAYSQAIQEIDQTATVLEVGCPEFVPLIESGKIHHPSTHAIVRHYLQPMLDQQIDALIYGCTHYPHLAPVIKPLLPSPLQVVDPAVSVAKAVAQELTLLGHNENVLSSSGYKATNRFFVSDRPRRFAQLASKLLGNDIVAETVNLELTPVNNSQPLAKYD